MIKKIAVAVIVVIVASLSVAGCTVSTAPNNTSPSPTPTATVSTPATPTPTPVLDYSSFYDKYWASDGGAIVEKPFTKGTNYRGNDVYVGVIRRTDRSQSYSGTCVIEHVGTKADAKKIYDEAVAKKQGEGYTIRSDWITQLKNEPGARPPDALWAGQRGLGQVTVFYVYGSGVSAWEVITQTA